MPRHLKSWPTMALQAHDIKIVLWEIPRRRVAYKARCPNLGA